MNKENNRSAAGLVSLIKCIWVNTLLATSSKNVVGLLVQDEIEFYCKSGFGEMFGVGKSKLEK